jgi:hypothetical protein
MTDDIKKETVVGYYSNAPTHINVGEACKSGIGMDIQVKAANAKRVVGLVATNNAPLIVTMNGSGTGVKITVG